MNADVDAFLNRDGSQPEELAEGGLLTHDQLSSLVDLNQDLNPVIDSMHQDIDFINNTANSVLPERSLAHDVNSNKV